MKLNKNIMEKLQILPELPGVYIMKNKKGDIIYIGKSKCLKKRVKSYFAASPKWEKAKKMVLFISDIDWIVTDTHLEAMLLECELIKRFRPYFNVIMKYENHYVYLKLDSKSAVRPVRVICQREEDSYGPFRSKNVLMKLFEDFRNLYPIIKNRNQYLFEYHIFPIHMDSEALLENYQVLLELCEKKQARDRFCKMIEKKMRLAAKEARFELAAFYRDFLNSFEYLKKGLDSCDELRKQMIFLMLELKQGYKLFFIVQGKIIHKEVYMEITAETKENFMKRGIEMIQIQNEECSDWKSILDYWDIIYSELKELHENQYECLPLQLPLP